MSSPYSIEAGIAIAPQKYAKNKYPFGLMKVGDSFVIADDTALEFARVKAAVAKFQKDHAPMRFSMRMDHQLGRHRVWRVE